MTSGAAANGRPRWEMAISTSSAKTVKRPHLINSGIYSCLLLLCSNIIPSCLQTLIYRTSMARSRRLDLNPFHDQIAALVASSCHYEFIRTTLEAATGTPMSRRTFTRRLRELGITTKPIVEDSPALRARIRHIFSTQDLTDAETTDVLASEGFKLSIRTLRRIRKDMGLQKNNRGGVEKTVRVGVPS